MGRPRKYASDAERQRAFRRRQAEQSVLVDRASLDRLHTLLDRLQAALVAAASHGDATARACRAASVETVLERLIAHFEARAAGGAERRAEAPSR